MILMQGPTFSGTKKVRGPNEIGDHFSCSHCSELNWLWWQHLSLISSGELFIPQFYFSLKRSIIPSEIQELNDYLLLDFLISVELELINWTYFKKYMLSNFCYHIFSVISHQYHLDGVCLKSVCADTEF